MASNPQHEPTMEEILASIRKIISDDAPEASAADAQAPETPAPEAVAPVEEADVLELTEEQEVTPEAAEIKTENDVIFQTIEEPAPVTPPVQEAPAPQAAAPQPEPEPTPAPAASDNDIFSDTTRKAMDDAFAHIPDAVEPEPAPAPHAPVPLSPVDGSSVETVFERAVRESFEPVLKKYLTDNTPAVIEGMKPLIRAWMDEHFPPLLEGAVRAEVERVVKARGSKR